MFAVVAVVTGATHGQEPVKDLPATPVARPHSDADAILRVTCEPESGLAASDLIDSLLRGPMFKKQAAPSPDGTKRLDWVMHLEPVQRGESAPHNATDLGSSSRAAPLLAGVYMTKINISSNEKDWPAARLLECVRKELARTLERTANDALRQQLDSMMTLKNRMLQGLRENGESLRDLAADALPSADQTVESEYARRVAAVAAMKIQIEGLDGRRRAIVEQIAKLADKIADAAANDPVLQELDKVVKSREQRAALMKHRSTNAANAVPYVEVLKSQEEVSEAKAELEKYRRIVAQAGGGDRLAELQSRLEDTAIELAEDQRKLSLLNESERNLHRDANEISKQKMAFEQLQQQYRDVLAEERRLTAHAHAYTPAVTLIPIDFTRSP
jgi:hypothetical protein